MCTGCSLCWDFCPRGGLRYEALGEVMAGVPADEQWMLNGGSRVRERSSRAPCRRIVSPREREGTAAADP